MTAKLYTNDPDSVAKSVKTAVESGNVKQKLAEANNSISSVQTTYISPNAPSSGGSSSNVGAIVGGVVGGLAALALMGLGFAVWHKKRRSGSLEMATLPRGAITDQRSAVPGSMPLTLPSPGVARDTGAVPSIALSSLNTSSRLSSLGANSSGSDGTSPKEKAAPAVPGRQSRSLKSPFSFFNSRMQPPTRPIDPFMSWVSDHVASNPQKSSPLGPFELDFTQLTITQPIGEGSFGRVYAGTLNGDPVAVKVLLDVASGRVNDPLVANAALNSSAPIMQKLHEEVKIMSLIDHPNVVRFIGVCSLPPCIVTELCSRGSLTDVLKNASLSPENAAELGWGKRLAMAIDAAEGMLYLHSQSPPIIHRDLKSANMLVTDDFRVRISDFNLSKILDDSTRSSSMAAMNPRWLAVELFSGARGSPACDVFAFGVVLWEFLTLEVPWGNTNPWQIVSTVSGGGRLPIPSKEMLLGVVPSDACYERFVALIHKCWAQIPEDRPEIGEVATELR